MTATEHYSTTDLNLAAYLVARGHPLGPVQGAPGERRTFRFEAAVRGDAEAFYRGASVPARAFAHALRDLKALLRDG